MNKRGIIVFVILFCFIYFFNVMTPLINDDYFAVFVWPEGLPLNGELPENAQRVSSIYDIFRTLQGYYLSWGGRVPGSSPVSFFVWQGKAWFNPVNALMFVILIAEIYWVAHEGIVSFDFNPSYVMGIFFSLWAFNCSFVDTCLWLSGSCNYLWMMVIVLAFLIPYTRNYYNTNYRKGESYIFSSGMFLLGILAGWSHETTTCWLIFVMAFYLLSCKKHQNIQLWKIAGFVGLVIGYGLLVFSPGNFARFTIQTGAANSFFVPTAFKLSELMLILSFHLFLYFYIIRTNLRFKLLSKPLLKTVKPYLLFSKACLFISLCSYFLMVFIPASSLRPSFLNLVYLVIAASLLVRAQEKAKISTLTDKAKSILFICGCFYIIITISLSIYCNLLNWHHWNSVLLYVKTEQMKSTENVLSVDPYFTHNNFYLWLAGTGFHLIYMPITTDENSYMNLSFSRYYDIKGIKVKD